MRKSLGLILSAAVTAIVVSVVSVQALDPLAYKVEFEGIGDESLAELVPAVSRLKELEPKGASSLGALRSRAQSDLERIDAVLRSEGYYDGSASYRVDAALTPVEVRVVVDAGPRYKLTEFRVVLPETTPQAAVDRVGAVTPKLVEPLPAAVAEEILGYEATVLAALVDREFPLAQVSELAVVVDHADRSVAVALHIEPGSAATFGELRHQGLVGIDPVFIERRITWKQGDPYDAVQAERTRRRLVETGLFTNVRVRPGEAVDENGAIPMRVDLTEGKHRSVGAGVGYSSTNGAGVNVFWEHRNLFGAGERLRFEALASELEQALRGSYREPDFLDARQVLLLDVGYVREDTDAFDSTKFSASAGIERRLSDTVFVQGGLSLERSTITEAGGVEEDFLLVGLPMLVRADTSNDLLDPTKGNRLELSAVPYLASLGSDVEFYVARLTDSLYLPIDAERRYVLALRGSVGSITGAERANIPADKRFYAGGGGSVRGYGYQLVGPLDAEGDPIGGRSLFEGGAELRIRLTESVGIVPFVEGGNVFDDVVPDFSQSLLWGAGIGLRYFTVIGPVRFDIGVPLDRRDGVDSAVEFYISLGQAF